MDHLVLIRRWANLACLFLYPVAWWAPLARAGVLPLFGLSEISVLSGIASLWSTDIVLAVVVALFAMVAPMAKSIAIALADFGIVRGAPRWVTLLGRLAMADVFLIALYITLAKGIGIGRLETGWGLYLFTTLVIIQFILTLTKSEHKKNTCALPPE
ncbi:paraquat-inducible protein A [Donghicola sp. XS_ASV15]|uniref:paraquat-inducible protein A n=1 Tax=Donghicola sp. XS_ASV15 TaxID=3241295 RepID=UPI003511356F